jgi:hypothetical protein
MIAGGSVTARPPSQASSGPGSDVQPRLCRRLLLLDDPHAAGEDLEVEEGAWA